MQDNIFTTWLSKAGITQDVAEMFNVHMYPDHFMLGRCIAFPVHHENGEFFFNKYRRNPLDTDTNKPKYVYDKGGKATLYGYHLAKDKEQILVTEGEKDCLVAWSHNIPAVTSTGGARSFQKHWVELLEGKDVIVCFDNDEAGADGMVRMMEFMPDIKIMLLPDKPGVKDISDYVANGGDLHMLMQTARSYKGIDEVYEDKERRKSLWMNTYFHDRYIKKNTIPKSTVSGKVKFQGDDLTSVKQVPIDSMIKFNGANKARCLWHSETTPSMHYYKENNRVYCFGCGKSADAISVYQALHKCSFKQALQELKKNII